MAVEPPISALPELIARTVLGDRKAFERLYALTAPRLFAMALRIVGEKRLAEEVLQESFVAIWRHAGDYREARGAPLTWMAAIVRNRSLDVVRRPRELADADEVLTAMLVDESAAPDADAQRRVEAHAVHECLRELEAEQRQSIALAFFHGLSHSELAAHLRRPLGTVKTHIRRGLARLRDCLMRDAGMARG